ncbi:hypothetical protein M413DRAFT_449207 [Hebeloma cylindrosporum]|uniref:Secreted protein n=1 Tax=Hebeloma cylindrosporum TaxID=76867 RepID=A0A0C3BW60_HEBCY|nr:hypothetical protein M413DRAFT_449207 [Hebeloma cylindrosporum h7]
MNGKALKTWPQWTILWLCVQQLRFLRSESLERRAWTDARQTWNCTARNRPERQSNGPVQENNLRRQV